MAIINDVKVLDGTDVPSSLTSVYTVTSPSARETINLLRFYNYSGGASILTIQIVESGGSTGNTKIALTKNLASTEFFVPSVLIGEGLDVGDQIYLSASVASSINVALTVKQFTS